MNDVPSMRRHASGQARVTLCGHDVYLGGWNSDEAARRYEETIGLWLANGRRWPLVTQGCLNIAELARRYQAWASHRFRKGGAQTTHAVRIARATGLLVTAGFGRVPAADFSSRHLRQFQAYLAGDPDQRWSCRTMNAYVQTVRAMFRWGISQEFFGPARQAMTILDALRLVEPVRPGCALEGGKPPRETPGTTPVDLDVVRATQLQLEPTVAAMIEVQLLTGMRPMEVVRVAPKDITPGRDGVHVFHARGVAAKLAHRGTRRMVAIGPKAWEILSSRAPANPSLPYFRPSDARAERRQDGGEGLRLGPIPDPDRYTRTMYQKAISRACKAKDLPLWAPNQLRHVAATAIATCEGLEVARLVLGHSRQSMTVNYVHGPDAKAIRAARRHG